MRAPVAQAAVAACLLVVATGCSPGPSGGSACSSDSECKGVRICMSGECVDPPASDAAADSTAVDDSSVAVGDTSDPRDAGDGGLATIAAARAKYEALPYCQEGWAGAFDATPGLGGTCASTSCGNGECCNSKDVCVVYASHGSCIQPTWNLCVASDKTRWSCPNGTKCVDPHGCCLSSLTCASKDTDLCRTTATHCSHWGLGGETCWASPVSCRFAADGGPSATFQLGPLTFLGRPAPGVYKITDTPGPGTVAVSSPNKITGGNVWVDRGGTAGMVRAWFDDATFTLDGKTYVASGDWQCGDDCDTCKGACTDLQTDPKDCGACGNVCAGALATCTAGKCGGPTVVYGPAASGVYQTVAADASNVTFLTTELQRCAVTGCGPDGLTTTRIGGNVYSGGSVYVKAGDGLYACPSSSCPSDATTLPNLIAGKISATRAESDGLGGVFVSGIAADSSGALILRCTAAGCTTFGKWSFSASPYFGISEQWVVNGTDVFFVGTSVGTSTSAVVRCPIAGCGTDGASLKVLYSVGTPGGDGHPTDLHVAKGTMVFNDGYNVLTCPTTGCTSPTIVAKSGAFDFDGDTLFVTYATTTNSTLYSCPASGCGTDYVKATNLFTTADLYLGGVRKFGSSLFVSATTRSSSSPKKYYLIRLAP